MELRQLRYFLAVAEELHFGRAAERLGIVQPTVSQQVRRLEREFGCELFDRTTRRVALTPAGHAFAPHARTVLAAEAAAVRAMAELRADHDATLRIGTNAGLGVRLEALLSHLAARTPPVPAELVRAPVGERLRRVREGTLDAAFVRGAGRVPGLELLPVWTDELVAALPVAHPLAAAPAVPIAALAAFPLRISPRETNPHLYDLLTAAIRAAGAEPLFGPPFTADHETLAAVGAGPVTWTVMYAPKAEVLTIPRVAFRPLSPPVTTATQLAVHPDAPARRLAPLLDAARAAAATTR